MNEQTYAVAACVSDAGEQRVRHARHVVGLAGGTALQEVARQPLLLVGCRGAQEVGQCDTGMTRVVCHGRDGERQRRQSDVERHCGEQTRRVRH